MHAIRLRDALDIKYGREGFILTHQYATWEEAYADMQSFATSGPLDLRYTIEEITQQQWDQLVADAHDDLMDKQSPEHRAAVDKVAEALDL